ncbi:Cof-type HAD-IIB family hydrolase [Runella sp.]|uniref:Cof-type HAD-IIB family hydrolase n=1 Tax=Runella sp. TaxID=1960881 RepID=UPI003D14FA5B
MKDIKLVATDMDGTLLNSKGELSEAFYPVLETLKTRGVHFAAASGRQYFNLVKRFEAVKDDVIFVAENGSYVVYQDQEWYLQALESNIAGELIKIARNIPNAYAIYCGKKKAYVESTEPKFWEQFTKYFERYELVEDLLEVTDDPCLKVSICDLGGSAANSYPHFKAWETSIQVKVSGGIWLDMSHRLANKGQALNVIQQRFGISPEQTMAFGDYLNDLEMLQQSYYSYAMENAHVEIKKTARFRTKSNDENGVMEIVQQWLKEPAENKD